MTLAINCNLCNCDSYNVLRKQSDLLDLNGLKEFLNIGSEVNCVQCSKCGLIFLNPMPTFDELKQYYEEDYDNILQRNYQSYLKGFESIKSKLEKYENYVKMGRLLDIGCGTGNFVFRAQELGWEAYGIEVSKRHANFLRNELGLNVMNVSIDEANFDSEYFDVVILNHVLEHLNDPKSVLKKIYGFLRKGGILVIYVPNEFECLYSKLKLYTLLFYFQPRDRPTDHLYFFNKQTIRLLLRTTGYEIIHLTTENFRINTHHKNRYGLVGDIVKKVYCWLADSLKMGDVMNIIAIKD